MSYIVNSQIFETESDAAFEHVSTYLQDADSEFLKGGPDAILAAMANDGWRCTYQEQAADDDELTIAEDVVREQIVRYLDETCLECTRPEDQCSCEDERVDSIMGLLGL
jgi:hypothetical protein